MIAVGTLITERPLCRTPLLIRVTLDKLQIIRAEGGRRREFLDLAVELHELLDRRPWEVDVFYVDAMKPSDDQDQGDWVGAAAARRALVAALRQQGG